MDVTAFRRHVEEPKPELFETTLVAASLAGPIVWLTQLTVAFALVGPLCQAQLRWPLHVVTAVGLAVVAAAVVLCWRRRHAEEPVRRIATSGVVLGVFFTLVMAALHLPVVLLHPCL
jgi:hypothetical protein